MNLDGVGGGRGHARFLQVSKQEFADSAAWLIRRVDDQNELQAPHIGRRWLDSNLAEDVSKIKPEPVRNIYDFTQGFLRRAKAEFENTKYAERVCFAFCTAFLFSDVVTDYVSAALLSFVQSGGEGHGQSLFIVLALHKAIEIGFLYFVVYGTCHIDLVYSLCHVKGIVGASRVISDTKRAEDARLGPVDVLFILMLNDMCVESCLQVSGWCYRFQR